MTVYATNNPKTKKALKDAVNAGQTVRLFHAGIGTLPDNGDVAVSGPHYPEPHRWYAICTLSAGKVVAVK